MYICINKNKQTMKTIQILKAETLGMIAFAKGQKCVAAWDKELMNMLSNRKLSETPKNEASTIELLKSWNNGWNKANIQAAK